MTSLCLHKYFKNDSVVSVSYKRFHDTPDDVYPSISLCFQSLRSGPFMDTDDIKKNDIRNMMTGITAFNQSLLGNLTYEDITIKLEIKASWYKILSSNLVQIPCAGSECFKTYGDGRIKCFTHDISFEKNLKYQKLVIRVKKTWPEGSQRIKIFIHYPGQIFRNGIHHVLKDLLGYKEIDLNIQSVTVLRKRKDGSPGCNSASSDDDEIILRNTVKQFNCRAMYPGQYIKSFIISLIFNILPFPGFNMVDTPPCNNKELEKISKLVKNNLMMESYQATPEPCTTMKIGVVPNIQNTSKIDNNTIRFAITFPVEYTEIKEERVNTY